MIPFAGLARSLAIMLAAWSVGAPPAVAADLVIGVRADAPPFSYLAMPQSKKRSTEDSPPTGSGEVYTGYMANICASVLARMSKDRQFSVEWREVSAQGRFDELKTGRIDILCDPATITPERLSHAGVIVSPPVYLSGVGRAVVTRDEWAGHWPCIGPVVGIVKGTTAGFAISNMAANFGFGETFSPIVQAHPDPDKVVLTDDERQSLTRCPGAVASYPGDVGKLAPYAAAELDQTDPASAVVVRSYPDYESLAKALCSGEIYYSAGDLEIISLSLTTYKALHPGCQAQPEEEVFSEERYAIFVHVSDAFDAGDRLALAFLRQLSIEIHQGSDSVLVRSFSDNFTPSEISRSLDLFLWSVVARGKLTETETQQ